MSDLSGDSGNSGVVLSGNNGAIVPTGSLEDRVVLLTYPQRPSASAGRTAATGRLCSGGLELRGQLEQQTSPDGAVPERQRQLYQELGKVANSQPAAAPATPAAGAATPPAAAANYSTNQDENQAYDAAVNMVLKEKNYDKAIPAFEGFIKQFPELQLCSQCPLLAQWPADVQQG